MEKKSESLVIVIMAAGKGTRMHSDKAKVLHSVCGRPMILHVVDTATKIAGKAVVIVIGHQAEKVKAVVAKEAEVLFALQKEQKGTGHAVKAALPVLPENSSQVIILSGDVPLIKADTVQTLLHLHLHQQNAVTVLGVQLEKPYGYGRILVNNAGDVDKIVEETDATEAQKKITIVNSGVYCVHREFLETSLMQLQSNNKQNEIYLTDIVEIAKKHQKKIGLMICPNQNEVQGVNTPQDLLDVECMIHPKRPLLIRSP